jgi:hypothetical protein
METQDLLFAAEVRKLAVSLANGAADEYKVQIAGEPDREEKLDKFVSELRAADYAEDAYNRIVDTAEQIENFKMARQARKLEGNKYAPHSQRAPGTSSEKTAQAE